MDRNNFVHMRLYDLSYSSSKKIEAIKENIENLKRRKSDIEKGKKPSPCGDYDIEQFNVMINIQEAALRAENMLIEVIYDQIKSYAEGGEK